MRGGVIFSEVSFAVFVDTLLDNRFLDADGAYGFRKRLMVSAEEQVVVSSADSKDRFALFFVEEDFEEKMGYEETLEDDECATRTRMKEDKEHSYRAPVGVNEIPMSIVHCVAQDVRPWDTGTWSRTLTSGT